MWEYRFIWVDLYCGAAENLNELGKNGWELVSMWHEPSPSNLAGCVFKRYIEDDADEEFPRDGRYAVWMEGGHRDEPPTFDDDHPYFVSRRLTASDKGTLSIGR